MWFFGGLFGQSAYITWVTDRHPANQRIIKRLLFLQYILLYKGSFIFHEIQKETILVWKGKETLIRISWNGKIDTTTEKCSGKSIFCCCHFNCPDHSEGKCSIYYKWLSDNWCLDRELKCHWNAFKLNETVDPLFTSHPLFIGWFYNKRYTEENLNFCK